jgi:WS/DGAT/MGAT family acyltransferase
MPQQHMDRLNAVDAAFLHQEDPCKHMHIGGVAIFDGPPPRHDEFVAHIESRLPLVPRYRQKLAAPPLGLGRQRWIDDPTFNLEYHVRHTALPRPGDEDRLRRLTGRVFSQALDRTRPLWEMWLVEGLAGGRFALLSKSHHALVDGVSGVDLTTVLFDADPIPREVEDDRWQPRPEPSPAELSVAALGDWARGLGTLPVRVAGALARPEKALADARDALEGIAEIALQGVAQPAPDTPLNIEIGPHRGVTFVSTSLAELKEIKDALGGTVNDVVLAVVAGALGRFLHSRGLRTEGLELRACVPISIRGREDSGALGNRLTQVTTPLPIYVADPVGRLRRVRRSMGDVKESKQALGARTISELQDFAPPTILAQASRLNFSSRFYNVLVTNVPGPQVPLYVLGRELRSIFPVAFLAGDRALAIAAMSYNGRVDFGLIADLDAVPDLDVLAQAHRDSLAELRAAARAEVPTGKKAGAARRRSPKRRSPDPRRNGRSATLEPGRV